MSLHPLRVSALELSPPPRSRSLSQVPPDEQEGGGPGPVLGWRVPSAQEASKMAGWGQRAGDCLLVEIFSLRHNLTYLQAQGTLLMYLQAHCDLHFNETNQG